MSEKTPVVYKRKCVNWLASYKDWILPRIAAPESYVFWTGMFCLSAAIRRKVYIGKSSLGTWECFPHCYIMLVGPPGFRKNTSMGPGIELLQELSDTDIISKAPAFITKESLLDSIFKSRDSSIYLTVEEFGDLLLKSGPEMYEFLTSMFDAKKSVEQKTLARSYESAEKPCLNFLAGTTPQWIAEKMPESVIGGGLASRIIFIFEEKEPPAKIFFKGTGDVFTKLKKDLVDDLAHIANNIEGEFTIPDDVKEWMEDWNRTRKKNTNPKLSGFNARKITHILKVAQLCHISYADDLVLNLDDIKFAIDVVQSTERNLPRVFAGVGKNIYSLDTRDIVKFINDNPNVTWSRLLREFSTVATVDKMEVLIQGLQQMKLVDRTFDPDQKDMVCNIITTPKKEENEATAKVIRSDAGAEKENTAAD